MATQDHNPPEGTPLYETRDLNIAGFLLTKKIPFRGSVPAEDNRSIVFRFTPDERITSFIEDYASGAEVVARDFASALRFLTQQIRQNRRAGGGR